MSIGLLLGTIRNTSEIFESYPGFSVEVRSQDCPVMYITATGSQAYTEEEKNTRLLVLGSDTNRSTSCPAAAPSGIYVDTNLHPGRQGPRRHYTA